MFAKDELNPYENSCFSIYEKSIFKIISDYRSKELLTYNIFQEAIVTQIPQAPWTATADTGSSILSFSRSTAEPMAMNPPMIPMIRASHGFTTAQPAEVKVRYSTYHLKPHLIILFVRKYHK